MTSTSHVWLQAEGWNRFPGLVHGFSGRFPTPGTPVLAPAMLGLQLCTLKQVHGDGIVVVQHSKVWEKRPEADGMITAGTGALLGIATADCVPVLMVAPEHGVVAAVHAGWRGTLKGISVCAVEAFVRDWKVDARHLWVALGPAIGGCCYEVGADIGEAFRQQWEGDSPPAWRSTGEKGFLDLRTINRLQLERAGVPPQQIATVGPCTFCDAHTFASYRREGAGAGRQLSVIGWRA